MKNLICLILLFISVNIYAQTDSLNVNKGVAVRDSIFKEGHGTICYSYKWNNAQPYLLIDGLRPKRNQLKRLDTSMVEKIEIIKDISKSIAQYGKKGRNGVILITTKKKKKNKRLN